MRADIHPKFYPSFPRDNALSPAEILGFQEAINSLLRPPDLNLLPNTDKDWAVCINLSERRHAVKIAAILAKTIGKKQVLTPLSIGIEGGLNTGKTLLLDVFASEFIDSRNAYHPPKRNCMFLERKPNDAYQKPLTESFRVTGREMEISFVSYLKINVPEVQALKSKNRISLVSFGRRDEYFAETAKACNFSLLIKLSKCGTRPWESTWAIYVAPELRTPEMRACLKQIISIGERLDKRAGPDQPQARPRLS